MMLLTWDMRGIIFHLTFCEEYFRCSNHSYPKVTTVRMKMFQLYMQDYFGYDVFFVMNITDIDDKIIKRYC